MADQDPRLYADRPEPAPRVNLLGVGVSAISLSEAVDRSIRFVQDNGHGYICVTGVHGIMEAQADERFRMTLNRSFLTTPDGMPTVWLGKAKGHRDMTRVYGPDFMLELCKTGVAYNLRHFLYGGKEGVAEQLKSHLQQRFPDLLVVGTYTPPFRPLNEQEVTELQATLAACEADVLWIGLSTPKQERFMAEFANRLPVKLMVGVGAAFDLLSGNLSEAPDWMKRSGLQWSYRLTMEPKRLWRRYLVNNPRFVWLTLMQFLGVKTYEMKS